METRISKREFNFVRIERRSNLLERRRWSFEGSLKGRKMFGPRAFSSREIWGKKLKRKEVKNDEKEGIYAH